MRSGEDLITAAYAAALLVAIASAALSSGEPSYHCEAYGSVVECKAIDVGDHAIEWAAVYEGNNGSESVYRAAGDNFTFRLHHDGRTVIEMHVIDADGFPPMRYVARWYKGRVIFEKWVPRG